jgi:endonuclease/exonuclease/phosphatase family metal-dependent hydrolase/membrane-associated phospholipid phosphatase
MTWLLVVAAFGFATTAAFAAASDAYGWELRVTHRAIHWGDWVTPYLRLAMQAGNQLVVAAVALVFVIFDRPRRAAITLLGGWGAWAASTAVKTMIDRPRPSATLLGFSPSEFVTGNGYPSGHTTIAVALAVVIVTTFGVPRWIKAVSVVAAVLTPIARLHLGVHWPLDVIGGACLGALVAGVVVVAIDPAPIRPPWPGVGVWPPVVPGTATVPLAAANSSTPLRVATFNIRNGRALDGRHLWPLRRRSTLGAIEDLDADVIGLQEVYAFQRRWLERRLPDRRWAGGGRTDGLGRGEQCPIAWRPDRLQLDAWEVRWLSEEWDVAGSRLDGADFPRIATIARFTDLSDGRSLGVINAHFDAKRRMDRILSAQLITDWMGEHDIAWVVMGDLNDVPDSPPVQQLLAGGLVAADPVGGLGTSHQFTGRTDGRRIDHILVTPDLSVVTAEVAIGRAKRPWPSDHWPLQAELVAATP